MDAVQQANSGHPGTPMAMAPVAYCLWQRFLRFDPDDPIWPNRDRFVLSAGHASMLLYSLLHLTGVKAVNPQYERLGDAVRHAGRHQALPPARLASVRATPSTAGPRASRPPRARSARASPRAWAWRSPSRWLGQHLNRPDFPMFDYDVYSLGGDGCIMEGISNEAASLAGHLKLSNLCWIYDNNHITIEGHTALRLQRRRGRALSRLWLERDARGRRQRPRHAGARLPRVQGHDRPAHADHRRQPHRATARPTSRTPPPPTASRSARKRSGSPRRTTAGRRTPSSSSPTACASTSSPSSASAAPPPRAAWMAKFDEYKKKYPESADHILMMQHRELPAGWDKALAPFPPIPRDWPRATPRARCSMPWPRPCRG